MRKMLICLVLAFLCACTSDGDRTDTPVSLLDAPTGPNARGPKLNSGSDGEIALSWMESDEAGTTLWYSTLEDGGWSPRVAVVSGQKMFVNWADIPSVKPLGGGHWAAHWLEKVGALPYSYHIVVSQSFDGGLTWSQGTKPHTDDTPTEHGFVSLLPTSNSAGAIWLDGRKTSSGKEDDPMASGMTLRWARIDRTGQILDEQEIDPLICDCCQTDVAATEHGAVAVYRDRSKEEIRDIFVTRLVGNRWQPAVPLNDDGWRIAGCPVNGPAVAARGDRVAAIWFSAPHALAAVRVTFSDDGGASFGAPIDVAVGRTLGRADIVLLADSTAVVSWLDAGPEGSAELRVRRVHPDGTVGAIRKVADGLPARSVPQLALAEDSLILAWSEIRDSSVHVVTARLPVDGLAF